MLYVSVERPNEDVEPPLVEKQMERGTARHHWVPSEQNAFFVANNAKPFYNCGVPLAELLGPKEFSLLTRTKGGFDWREARERRRKGVKSMKLNGTMRPILGAVARRMVHTSRPTTGATRPVPRQMSGATQEATAAANQPPSHGVVMPVGSKLEALRKQLNQDEKTLDDFLGNNGKSEQVQHTKLKTNPRAAHNKPLRGPPPGEGELRDIGSLH